MKENYLNMLKRAIGSNSTRILAIPALALLVAVSMGATFQDYSYVGVDGCKMCHRSAAKGNQAGKWAEGPHARAYEGLASDKSKEVAQAAGVGNPQEADECLVCHVTGHGKEQGPRYKLEDGVGCESCHGAGSAYNKMNIMRDYDASVANGMIEITEATCTACHNEKSPTFQGFNYEEALKVIAHPNPQK
jgi:hypothetical protein